MVEEGVRCSAIPCNDFKDFKDLKDFKEALKGNNLRLAALE